MLRPLLCLQNEYNRLTMYRDDYILRMIRQFGQIVTYVLGLRRARQYPLALIAIDNALRDRLGIGSDDLATRSEGEILALVRFGEREESWREVGAYVAALFYAEAEIYRAQDQPDHAAPRALRALQLLAECALDAPEPLPDYAPPRAELLAILKDYHLPRRTRAALFRLAEAEGRFDEAEDQLFDLIAEHPGDPELIATGADFFERLLALTDEALAAGGLSRDEVEQGLAELRAAGPSTGSGHAG